MAQPTLPTDKTVRVPVKLVTTAGDELPFHGFALIPEDRLSALEKVAVASKDLVAAKKEATANPIMSFKVEAAVQALDKAVDALQDLWEIPK